VTPKLSYRYIPSADKGQQYIPQIDNRVFDTALPPLELGDQRNIDDLSATNTLRLGLDNIRTLAVDWSVGGGALPSDFEFALVDAPCTGSGTLYKRPEILERLSESDPGRMGELATQILRNVGTHCRSGAEIVYAVCSVLPEEGEQVLERVNDIFERGTFKSEPLRSALGADVSFGLLLPLRHGTDGYFVASLRKR